MGVQEWMSQPRIIILECPPFSEKRLKVLVRVRETLSKGWIKGTFAKDAFGKSISYRHSDATQFCFAGAILKELDQPVCGDLIIESMTIRMGLERLLGIKCLVSWNDAPERTKEDVLEFLDGIISKYILELDKMSITETTKELELA